MSTPHILLVDDDPSLLQALSHMLTLRLPGGRIDTAQSAHQALALLQQHDYETIISDVKMPGMDGLELLAQISSVHPDTPHAAHHWSWRSGPDHPGPARRSL